MSNIEAYKRLAEKYGPTTSGENFLKMCEVVMTPEECGLILELFTPMTPGELAKKLNADEKSISAKLDNMARRGLLFRGKTQYAAWQDNHQFNVRISHSADEYIPPALVALREGRRQQPIGPPTEQTETYQRLQRFRTTGVPLHRMIPARLAILASPKIKPEQVLWYEDMAEIIRRNGGAGVVDCPCRRYRRNCDRPLWVCLHFGREMIDYEVGRGGRMKDLSVEEAIAASDLAENGGLVHGTPVNNASIPGVVCNCCTCCCGVLGGAVSAGGLLQEYAPSRYRGTVEQELCTGCQECVERCMFDAIEMVKPENSKKMKARVIAEKCMGCGVCVLGCESKALTFELVRPPEHIPPAPAMPRRGVLSQVK